MRSTLHQFAVIIGSRDTIWWMKVEGSMAPRQSTGITNSIPPYNPHLYVRITLHYEGNRMLDRLTLRVRRNC
jgi:hypothetical protein